MAIVLSGCRQEGNPQNNISPWPGNLSVVALLSKPLFYWILCRCFLRNRKINGGKAGSKRSSIITVIFSKVTKSHTKWREFRTLAKNDDSTVANSTTIKCHSQMETLELLTFLHCFLHSFWMFMWILLSMKSEPAHAYSISKEIYICLSSFCIEPHFNPKSSSPKPFLLHSLLLASNYPRGPKLCWVTSTLTALCDISALHNVRLIPEKPRSISSGLIWYYIAFQRCLSLQCFYGQSF